MNNVGNALLTNSGATVNSAVNSVSQAFGAFGTFSALGTWVLITGIILLLLLAYMLNQNQITITDILPSWNKPPRDWREIQQREAREARETPSASSTPSNPSNSSRDTNTGFGENWCFVGEDVTGRWCVKVPKPDACSPERLFSSRPGCELVPASPLPLGVVNKNGDAMKPMIAAAHTK